MTVAPERLATVIPFRPRSAAATPDKTTPAPQPRAVVDADGTLRCPDCRSVVLAEMPLIADSPDHPGHAATVLIDSVHPAGNLVVVGHRVRYRRDNENTVNVDGSRRREHECPNPAMRCMVCGGPGRLRPSGIRCDTHTPDTGWATGRGGRAENGSTPSAAADDASGPAAPQTPVTTR